VDDQGNEVDEEDTDKEGKPIKLEQIGLEIKDKYNHDDDTQMNLDGNDRSAYTIDDMMKEP
jgi:hypothetical protein